MNNFKEKINMCEILISLINSSFDYFDSTANKMNYSEEEEEILNNLIDKFEKTLNETDEIGDLLVDFINKHIKEKK